MIIESIGHGVRILIQMHPRNAYTKNIDRTTAMFESIENFEFKNEEHRLKLIHYIRNL